MKVLEWLKEHIMEIIVGIFMILISGLIALAIMVSVENEINRISEGVVIDKNYSGTYTTVVYTEVGDNKIPQTVHHPESYELKIQGEKDGEIVEYWFECTSEEYHQYKIGDYYRK